MKILLMIFLSMVSMTSFSQKKNLMLHVELSKIYILFVLQKKNIIKLSLIAIFLMEI
ncbi:hypothetical protein J2Y60_003533 [Arcicella sp. BE140]|nr:hypothetical protein [Arcicella sp. BE51]MDR6813322.1 hypothetical protein [Arcicella sp. BE140]MDR6824636.1 hypothetical protein [Arcicella sp. BE139]